MKKVLAIMLVALVALAAFAGGIKEETPSIATTYEELQTVQVGTGVVDFSGKTPYKDEITIGVDAMLVTLDPYGNNSAASADYLMPCYDRLINFNEDTQSYEPELATKWEWTDPTTLKCYLRNDVKFTDGSQFTSADVKYSYEKMKESATIGGKLATLDSVECIDDYTVVFHLNQVNVDFLNAVSYFGMGIVKNGAYDTEEGYRVTTGAWIVTDFVPGDHYTMVRNENYWSNVPVTKKMTLKYYPEASARLIALQNGEIDICLRVSEDEAVYAQQDPNIDLTIITANTVVYFAFNTEAGGAASDENFRLALAYCINKDDIISAAANGYGTPAITNWGRTTYGNYAEFGDYGQNYDKVAEYLAKTPYRDITVIVRGSKARDLNTCLVIQAQAKKAGINVNVEGVESATLTANTKWDNPNFESVVYTYGWSTFGDDCRNPYYTGLNSNRARVNFNELVDKGASELDDAARKAIYAEIQIANHEHAYYLPLFYTVIFQGIQKGVTGVIWGSGVNDFTYACKPL